MRYNRLNNMFFPLCARLTITTLSQVNRGDYKENKIR